MCSDRQNKPHPINSDIRIQTVGIQPPFKGGWYRSPPNCDWPVWRSKWIHWEIEDVFFRSRRTIFEIITCNASDPVSKFTYKIPQENKWERGISHEISNSSDKIYREVIQYWLHWDKNDAGKYESFMRHQCPIIWPKTKTWIIRDR